MIYKYFANILVAGLLVTVGWASAGYSQSDARADSTIKRLSLSEALSLAEKQNYRIRQAEQQINITRAQFRKTNALFLPQLSIEEQAVTTTDPLQAFGMKLKQEQVTAADFNPQVLNDPDRITNYATSFKVEQPLFNLDQWYQRSALDKKVEGSRQQWHRTQYGVRFQVKRTYYTLILQKARRAVIDTALAAAQKHLQQAEDYYQEGMINKASMLSARVRVNNLQSKRLEARHQQQNQEDQLRYLIGLEDETAIRLTDSLDLSPVSSPLNAYRSAIDMRSDIRALKYRVDAARDMLSASRLAFVPSINLFGRYEFNDDQLLGTQADNYLVGATLQWDLFSGFKNIAGVQQSRHELEKAKLAYIDQTRQSRTEVRKVYRSLQDAREQVEIAEVTMEQAAEDLRIRSNRFEQGMEKTTDLLRAEVQLEEARMKRLQALYKYNTNLAKLEFLLEQDL